MHPTIKLRFFIIAITFYVFWMNSSPANLCNLKLVNRVEIDGVNYGSFKMELMDTPANVKMVLSRSFITEPSLYLWAEKSITIRGLQDLHIVTEGNGNILDVKSLKCHPLKWEIEKEDSGFREVITLAIH